MSCKLFRQHKWKVIAVDIGTFTSTNVRNDTKNYHQLSFELCEQCSERRVNFIDPDESNRNFAKNIHSYIPPVISKWVALGKLYNSSHMHWKDETYQPAASFLSAIERMINTENFKETLGKNPTVVKAIDELITVVKLVK